MKHPIPDAALDDRLGIVGMTGAGKTFGVATCVERILAKHGRVIIPDPLGVWYGLRLLADGKTASNYDVVIFGGPHADLPITPHAGALIGETVATMRESAILDLSQFETAASERRFMRDFLDALYRKAAGDPVHLVFDEADLWAPERIMDKEGDATKLHGIMQTVVRRGRIKGLTSWLISQRPASLSKNVLSQVDGLAAFRLTASQDRKALGLWIEGQADRDAGKAILDRLPTKGQGEAVVWLPQRGILSDVTFPPRLTFDSSRAPKRGEKTRKRELPPINLSALKDKLTSVEAETKANDPKALRAEIARLTADLRKAPQSDQHSLTEANRMGYNQGVTETRHQYDSAIASATRGIEAAIETLRRFAPSAPTSTNYRPPPTPAAAPRGTAGIIGTRDSTLPKAERRILTALAQYPEGRTKSQVAILTGYAINGGGFNNALGALRKADYIRGSDRLLITSDGRTALGSYDPLPFGAALLDHWIDQLPKAEKLILAYLAQLYPQSATKEEAARSTGYEPNGGGFNNALGRLRKLELIDGRGEMKASDHLFG